MKTTGLNDSSADLDAQLDLGMNLQVLDMGSNPEISEPAATQAESLPAPDLTATSTAEAPQPVRTEVVFIMSDVADYQTLVNGVKAGTEVHVLAASGDGLAQMAAILAGRSGVDAIHVVSHGAAGSIKLGALSLSSENLKDHAAALSGIGGALAGDADIFLYGCNVAANEYGRALIDGLAAATNADVAASDDLTGSAALGGDWDMEFQSGAIGAQEALDYSALQTYENLLVPALTAPATTTSFTVVSTTTVVSPTTISPISATVEGWDISLNFPATATYALQELYHPTSGVGGANGTNSSLRILRTSGTTVWTDLTFASHDGSEFQLKTLYLRSSLVPTITFSIQGYRDGFVVGSAATPSADTYGWAQIDVSSNTALYNIDKFILTSSTNITNLFIDEIVIGSAITTHAPSLSATGATATFTQNSGNGVDLFSNVNANSNDSGQTFSSAVFTVSNVADTTEYLTISGADIALTSGNSGSISSIGNYSVSVTSGTATLTLSGMTLSDSAMGTLVDGITYRNSDTTATAGARTITLTTITDSGSSLNTGTINASATVTVTVPVNIAPVITEKAALGTAPSDDNFEDDADGSGQGISFTLDGITYRTDGDGTIDVVSVSSFFGSTPFTGSNFAGNAIHNSINGATNDNISFFSFESASAGKFKLNSLSLGTTDNPNRTLTPDVAYELLFTVKGYSGGIGGTLVASVDNFDTSASGTYGSGTNALVYTLNSNSSMVTAGGNVSFGSGWDGIDTVVFERTDSGKDVWLGLDALDFSPASVNVTTTANTSTNIPLNATDADGDTISWSISGAASHGTASVSGTGASKTIVYSPTSGYTGGDSFSVQVSDGNGGTETVGINVLVNPALNSAPTIGNLNGDSVTWPGAGNSVTLDSGGNAVLSDSDLTALNGGNGDWAGASLSAQRSGTAVAADIFGFDTSGALFTVNGGNLESGGLVFATFTQTGGVLTISFTSSGTFATTALVNDVAQRITYRNDTPAGDAAIRLTLSDGLASDTADVTVASDTIYVTNASDISTIDTTDGVSFGEAVAIAAADGSGNQTLAVSGSLAGTGLTINSVSLGEDLTLDMDAASGTTLSGGTLTVNSGNLSISNGAGDTATLSNAISGSGGLTKIGAGNLSLSGSNGYSGLTTVSAGTLTLSGGNAISDSGSVSVAAGATVGLSGNETVGGISGAGSINLGTSNLTVSQNADNTFSGDIGGTGGLSINQGGSATYSLTLSGNNSYTGATTTINSAWLKLDGDGAISNNAALRVNGSSIVTLLSDQTVGSLASGSSTASIQLGSYTLTAGANDTSTSVSGVISGAGALVKQGSGTMTLSGTNTYSGTTTVSAGALSINSDSNLGSGGLTLAGSTTLEVTGATTIDNGITLGGDATVTNTANITLSGSIGGAHGLIKSGSSVLTLSGSSSYSGTTTVSAGTLSIGSDGNLGGGNLTLASGTTLAVTGATTVDNGIALSGAATLQTDAAVTLSGALSGTAHLTKTGAGTLTLTNTSNEAGMSGGITVAAGTLTVGDDDALAGGSVTLASGTTLQVTGATAIDNAVALSGAATIQTDSAVTLSGALSGGAQALTKTGSGSLTLTHTGNEAGLSSGVMVSAGTLAVTDDDALPDGTVTLAAGTTLQVTGATAIDNAVALNGAATIRTDAALTLSGALSGGAQALTKTGAGTLTLTNTGNEAGLTGGVTVAAGTLAVSNDDALVGGTVTLDGGTLAATGAATIDNAVNVGAGGGAVDLSAASLVLSGVVGGGGTLAVNSSVGGNVLALANSNTLGGGITLSSGIIQVGSDGALGTGTLTVLGGKIRAAGTNSYTLNNDVAIGGTFTMSGSGTLSFTGDVDLGGAARTINDSIGTNLTFSGAIGNGSLIVSSQGSGSVVLSGTNTYGATTVSAGKLAIAGNSNLGSGDVTLNGATATLVVTANADSPPVDNNVILGSGGGTLQIDAGATFSGGFSGTGTLTKTGAGALTLTNTGNETGMSGGINVAAGALRVATDDALPGGTVTLAAGTTLQVTGATTLDNAVALSGTATLQTDAAVTLSGALTGAADLTKTGSGTLTLSGTSNFAGSTDLAAGSLLVTGALTGSGAVSVAAATTLGGTGTIAGTVAVASGGTVAPGTSGAGTLTLGGLSLASGSILAADVTGAMAGSGYDQLVIVGTVSLGGATLSATFGSFVAAGGDSFILIDNDGSDAIAGTFNGLAEGADFTANGASYRISYVGGTGNDVVLSVVDTVAPAVSSVSVPADGTYIIGDNLDFTVQFDENTTVTGTPRLELTLATGGTVYADYVSGSGTTDLLFRYVVASGDLDADGVTLGTLSANGGTLKDAAGNDAVLTLNGIGASNGILVDGIAPMANSTAVSGSPAGNASTLSYAVTFSENVTGVDASDFTLTSTGTASGSIASVSGSGSSYTITVNGVAGDGSLRLDLNASGTGITDAAGNAMAGGFTSGTTFTLDHLAPTVGSVSVPADATYKTGDSLDFTVQFAEAISVVTTGGTPRLELTLATGGTVYANYVGGSGTTDLVFRYIVASGAFDGDGISLVALSANGGSLKDAAGNDAAWTLNGVGSATGVWVDGIVPTVASSAVSGSPAGNATTLTYAVNFSENATGVDASDFTLTPTGTASGSIAGVSGSGSSYTVTVNSVTGDGTLRLDLNSSGTGITDAAGNAIPGGFTGGTAFALDHTAPTVGSVLVPANGTYKAGDHLDFTVNFSEAVTVVTTGGTPALGLTLDTGGTVSAAYLSGSGTTALTFRYAVGSGVRDTNGFALGSGIVLNGGTLKDAGGNDGNLSLNNAGATSGVLVDGIAPTVSSTAVSGSPAGNATTLTYAVDFDENVTGVDASDFTLTSTGTASGSIASVSGSGSSYTVTVNGVAGDGSLRLDLNNSGTGITDAAGNAIPGGFTGGTAFPLDHTAPTIGAVSVPADGTYKTGDSLDFAVHFAEAISVVTTGGTPRLELTLATGGPVYADYVSGSGTTDLVFRYIVASGAFDGDGISVGALTANGGSLKDTAGNDAVLALSSIGATAGVWVDGIAPTVSSTAVSGSPAGNATTLTYAVDFDENVTGVDASDFTLTSTGTPGGSIASVSGSGSSYTVTVNGVSGDGSLRLDLNASGTGITDAAGNAIPGGFTGGTAFALDHTAPTVGSVSVPAGATYKAGDQLDFTVNFAEAVTVVTTGGTPRLELTLATGGTVYADYVSGSGTTNLVFRYIVATGELDADGVTLGALSANGGSLKDTAGNDTVLALNGVGATSGILVDGIAPTVSSTAVSGSPAGSATTLTYAVNFDENVSGVDTSDFTLTSTGSASGTIAGISGSGSTYTVTVNSVTGDGTLRLDLLPSGTGIADTAGNAIAGGYTGGSAVSLDHTAPSATAIARVGSADTHAGSVSFTVSFDEAVTGVDAADFTLDKAPGVSVTNGDGDIAVTGSGDTYTVTVSNVSGDGALSIDLKASGTGIADLSGNAIGGGFNGGDSYTVDTTVPYVVEVTAEHGDGAYTVGGFIGIAVVFSEAVTVSGSPQIALETGTVDRVADYGGTYQNNRVIFNYVVQAGDTSADLAYLGTSALSLNGGTIRDAAGNDAILTLPAPGATGSLDANKVLVIDTTAPAASSIAVSGSPAGNATTLSYDVNFDENVSGVDVSDFVLTSTGTAAGTIASISGSGSSYTVTVNSVSGDGSLRLDLNSSGTGIADTAGNTIVGGFTGGSAFALEHTAPTAGTVTAADMATVGGTSYTLTVAYADGGSGIDGSSIGIGDIAVTAPGGGTLTVTGASWNAASGEATYTLAAPGGTWDSADNGSYSVAINGGEVADTAGNFVAADGSAGSFTVAIQDAATSVTAANGVSEPVALASTVTSAGSAVSVFDFKITDNDSNGDGIADGGSGDGFATTISRIALNTSGTGDFSKVAWLLSGAGIAGDAAGTYDAGTQTIVFSGLNLSVADNASETYTVNAYYNTNTGLIDGQTYGLSVNGSSAADFTIGSGSQMASGQTVVTNGGGTAVDVTATRLVYGTAPAGSVSGAALSTQAVVRAEDAFGNLDTDFTGTVTLALGSGAGSLGGTTSLAATAGVASFSGIRYDAASDHESFSLTASSSGLAGVTSSAITSDGVATRLVFGTQPAPTAVSSGENSGFSTVPVVWAVDANGLIDTDFNGSIQLSVTDPDDSILDGILTGLSGSGDSDGSAATVTLTASNGVANFAGLAIHYTAGGNGGSDALALRATAAGLSGVNSSGIAVANGAPAISAIADQAIAEDGDTGVLNFTIGDRETAAGSLTVTATSSDTALIPNGGLVLSGTGADRGILVTPAANASGTATITVSVSDGVTTTQESFDVTVGAINDAPSLAAGTTHVLAGTDEDSASAGTAVSAILGTGGWTDADGGALAGMAIIGVTGNGTWQYSADGAVWQAFGAVSAGSALLLDGTSQVRYLPDGVDGETATFSYRAWDQTSGTASTNGTPQTADTTANGGATAFSANTGEASLSVNAVNDAPTDIALSDNAISVYAGINGSVGYLTTADVDPADSHTYSLVSGSGDTDNGLFNISGGLLRVNDAAALSAGTYTVRIRGTDSGALSLEESFTITVNDALGVTTGSDSGADAGTGGDYSAELADGAGLSLRETLALASGGGKIIGFDAALSGSAIILASPVAVAAGTTLDVDGPGLLTIGGSLLSLAGELTAHNGEGDSLTLGSDLSGTGSLTKTGGGSLVLSGSSDYSGATSVSAGSVLVTGSLAGGGAVTVAADALLGGTGSIAGTVTALSGGTIGAGTNDAGSFTLGGLALQTGSALAVEVLGTAAGSGYDQLTVNGTVDLGGATLSLNFGGFDAATGNSFTLIDNDGSDAVVGTFAGLAEGALFTRNGMDYRISYAGGTGNDVVLTAGDFTPPSILSVAIPDAPMKIGDTVTAAITVAADSDTFALGAGSTIGGFALGNLIRVSATTYTASFTVTEGGGDVAAGSDIPVNLTLSDGSGNDSSAYTTPIAQSDDAVDAHAPIMTDANIALGGATGTGGVFRIGDTVTMSWNASAIGGDGNTEAPASVTVDFSVFGGGSAVTATQSGGIWTASYTIAAGTIEADNRNVTVTAVDAAGNATTQTDSTNAGLDNLAPGTATGTLSVMENAANGTAVGTVSAAGAAAYALLDDADGRFAIDSTSGAVTVADGGRLDYEASASHALTVRVTDSAGNGTDTVLTVAVTDAAEAPTLATPPVIDLADTSAADVFEARTGTLSTTDAEGATLSYGIGGGTGSAGFSAGGIVYDVAKAGGYGTLYLNSATGQYLYLTDSAAIEALEAADHPADNFTVTVATASGSLTSSAALTVNLTGAEDAPEIAAVTVAYADTADDDVFPDTAGNLTVASRDGDTVFSFALTGGSASAAVGYDLEKTGLYGTLYLNSATGAYRYAADDGAIEALGSGAAPSETFTVTAAADGAVSPGQSIAIHLTGANDSPRLVQTLPGQAATEDENFTFEIPAGSFADIDAADSLAYSASRADGSALPGWLNFDAATRTFSGTPVNGNVGLLTVRVTATDGGSLAASDDFMLTVANVNDAPTLANGIADRTATEDSAFSFVIPAETFADADTGDALTYSASLADGSSLPGWLSFDAATRAFSGTPANGDAGSISVRVTATDGSGASETDDFVIAVANTNDAPEVAIPIADQSTVEDQPFGFTIPADTFVDIDSGDTLTFSATLADGSALPSWLSFDAATRTFSGTPSNSDVGLLNLRITATDSANASASDEFLLTVANVNDAPAAADDSADAVEAGGIANGTAGSEATGNVLVNDTDADAGAVRAVSAVRLGGIEGAGTAGTLGSALAGNFGSLTLAADGAYAYSIDDGNARVQALAAGESLIERFNYTVTDDGGLSDTAVLTVTIHGANDAPTVTGPLISTVSEGASAFTLNLLEGAADPDNGDLPSVTGIGFAIDGGSISPNVPAGFSLSESGLTVDPNAPAFEGLTAGQSRTVAVTYSVTDGHGGTVAQTATVTILGTDDTPVPAAPTVVLSNDTGASGSDAITRDGRLSVAGIEPDALVEYSTDSGATWSANLPEYATDGSQDGNQSVWVRQTNGFGNVSSPASLQFVLDTQAPDLTVTEPGGDGLLSASEDDQVSIGGTSDEAPGRTVEVAVSDGARTVAGTALIGQDGSWTVIGLDLSGLGEGTLDIQAAIADLAGNRTVANGTVIHDTLAPTVAISSALLTADTTPLIFGTTDLPEGSSLSLVIDPDANPATDDAVSFTATVGEGGAWSVDTGSASPASGSFPAGGLNGLAGLRAVVHDAAGNEGIATGTLRVDTTPPHVSIDAINPDSGRDGGDFLTRNPSLAISGSADSGSTVILRAIDSNGQVTVLGSAVAADGIWSIDAGAFPFSEGPFTLQATATNVLGTENQATRNLVIDAGAPGGVDMALSAANEIGSPGLNLTATAGVGLEGSAEAHSTVGIFGPSGALLDTVLADANGRWALPNLDLSQLDGDDQDGILGEDGTYSFSAVATDAAGNSGPAGRLTVLLDTRPAKIGLAAGSDTGSSDADHLTQARSLVLEGTGPQGARLAVLQPNGGTLAIVTVDANGRWTLPGVELAGMAGDEGSALPGADGAYTFRSALLHGDGSQTPANSVTIRLDTTPPATPLLLDLQTASDTDTGTGQANATTDNITSDATPSFDVVLATGPGTGVSAGDIVRLTRLAGDGSEADLAAGVLGANEIAAGKLSLTAPELDDGNYVFRVRLFDPAGNVRDFTTLPVTIVTDQDGVSPSIESVVRNGDFNQDGVPDSAQSNVTALPLRTAQDFNRGNGADPASFGAILAGSVVSGNGSGSVALDTGAQIANVRVLGQDEVGAAFGAAVAAQMGALTVDPLMSGILDFTIKPKDGASGLTDIDPGRPGLQTQVVVELPQGVTADTYYKIGRTSADSPMGVYAFMATSDRSDGARFFDLDGNGTLDRVVITFTDGALGDDDLTQNGQVSDPGFLGFTDTGGTGVVLFGDTTRANHLRDVLHGTDYADRISGLKRADRLFGHGGDDFLDGGRGHDRIYAGDGDDQLLGGRGRDRLFGESGKDSLEGGNRRDWLYGADGNDSLDGGRGKDRLFGEAGNDFLSGGGQKDRLIGGSGDDAMQGGQGIDTYVYLSRALGQDDLAAGSHDLISDAGPRNYLDFGSAIESVLKIGGTSLADLHHRTEIGNALGADTNIAFDENSRLLTIDVNGDGQFNAAQDVQIELVGVNHVTYLPGQDMLLMGG